MNNILNRIIILSINLAFGGVIQAQDYFNTKLDTAVYITDTLFKEKSTVVTYIDTETNNKLIVNFDASSVNKPNGTCIYTGANGIKVEGTYKAGVLVGEWIEKDIFGSINKKVNYDYKTLDISRDSLNFEKNIKSDNEDSIFVADMPIFKNGNISELRLYVQEKLFLPASFRFFHKHIKEIKVFVQFEILGHEKVANVRCIGNNKPSDIENEAKRLIYSTRGLWRNAMHRGKPSDVTITIPIIFKTN